MNRANLVVQHLAPSGSGYAAAGSPKSPDDVVIIRLNSLPYSKRLLVC